MKNNRVFSSFNRLQKKIDFEIKNQAFTEKN